MAYSTETNNAILDFFSRAQTRISDNATADAIFYAEGDDDLDKFQKNLIETEDLTDVIYAIDNQYNNWTEPEIITVMDYFDVKYKLQNIPYVDREEFNLNFTTYRTDNIPWSLATFTEDITFNANQQSSKTLTGNLSFTTTPLNNKPGYSAAITLIGDSSSTISFSSDYTVIFNDFDNTETNYIVMYSMPDGKIWTTITSP